MSLDGGERLFAGAHWPGAANVFDRLDSEIALALLETYPSPDGATRLGEKHAGRSARPVPLDPEILGDLVLAQVRLPRTLLACIANLERAIAALLAKRPKAVILAPLPRVRQIVNLAQVLAEVVPSSTLLPTSSMPPPNGKTFACHQSLRQVQIRQLSLGGQHPRPQKPFQTFADNSRHASPSAHATTLRPGRAASATRTPSASSCAPGCA